MLNLAALDPSRVHGPVEVTELYQRLVPYRTHRTALGIDSHEDYEMTLLRLLSGERGYAFVEPEEARTALMHEAAGINPDTSMYKRFGAARVTFDPDHVRTALGGADAALPDDGIIDIVPPAPVAERASAEVTWFPEPPPDAPEIEVGAERPAAERPPEDGDEPELPFALDEGAADREEPRPRATSAPCAFCGADLPVGRTVIFCPHCGQNVGVVHCPACGTELDAGWRFCITCGRQMPGLG